MHAKCGHQQDTKPEIRNGYSDVCNSSYHIIQPFSPPHRTYDTRRNTYDMTNYKILELGGLFSGKAGPGISKAVIHKPIPTKGMTQKDLVDLSDRVYNIINNELEAYQKK